MYCQLFTDYVMLVLEIANYRVCCITYSSGRILVPWKDLFLRENYFDKLHFDFDGMHHLSFLEFESNLQLKNVGLSLHLHSAVTRTKVVFYIGALFFYCFDVK